MLSYRLPPAQVVFPDGVAVSLSKKIGSAAEQVAPSDSYETVNTLRDTDEPFPFLEDIHQYLDDLDTIAQAQQSEINTLRTAASALLGMSAPRRRPTTKPSECSKRDWRKVSLPSGSPAPILWRSTGNDHQG